MLLCGSTEYMEQPKIVCMIDVLPMSEIEKAFPPGKPKVVNTHYTLDMLPEQFKQRKTVLGMSHHSIFLSYSWDVILTNRV